MKLCKKILSVMLAIIIVVGCINVGFSPIVAQAATPTNAQLKAAFQAISNTTDLTNGDGTLLSAAEVLYNWAYGNAVTSSNGLGGNYNSPSLTAKNNNTIVNLNANAKSAVGSAYNTLINSLLPTASVYDDTGYKSYSKSSSYGVATGQSFDTGKLSYYTTSSPTKTVTVKANLEKTLLAYDSLSEVPATILLSVTYTYKHTYKTGYHTRNEDTKIFGAVIWRDWFWKTYSWNYLSAKPSRTVNSSNTQAYKDLHAFNDYFIKNNLYKTSLKDLCDKTAAEIVSIISANNTAYAKLNSYSANVKNHYFPMSEVDTFMSNCLYAQKVINSKPAITALNSAMAAGYDASDLSQMESIYTAQSPNLQYLSDKEDIITYISENYEGYDSFSLASATAFINQLAKDIELYKIKEIKAAVDSLRSQLPDAAAIAKIDTDASGNYINDNLTLWNYYDLITGYINALNSNFEAENVAEIFTEGTGYVVTFQSELKYEWDYRGAEEQYESYYSWFLPLIYEDLTKYTTEEIIGTGISAKTPNIPNATSKKNAYNSMYTKYTGLIGAEAMKVIFGDGENALGYVIDDYIERLYNVILARLTSEVDTAIGYYNSFGKITLDNFVAVKEAIGRVETDIWTFISKNNSSIISSTLRTNYNKLSTFLNEYNKFVAGDGLSAYKQQHLHDANGVFITREPTEYDKARVSGEDFNVTEEIILETIEKLDAFLTSNDFTELVDIDQNPDRDILLSDFIMESMAQTFYTDDFVNMIMNIVYPALFDVLKNDVYDTLPDEMTATVLGIDITFGLKYDSLADIISGLGLGIYPNQVDDYVSSSYGTAKTQLSKASSWESLQDKDGNLTLDWGIDAIKPENYSTTQAYLNAKKNKFLGAVSESFDAILPLVRVLLGDVSDIELFYEEAGAAVLDLGWLGEYDLAGDLTITADGCAGYSDVVVPILEAIGCTGIATYSQVKAYTTSRQYVNAIFNPIINFMEKTLANSPVETVASILPNLAYAIPFDKLWDLIDKLNININYLVEDTYFGIEVQSGSEPVKFNSFVTKDTIPLEFDISSFSEVLKFILSSFMPNIDFSTLPILNSGEFINYSKLNKNASTLRKTGSRMNFVADKADVFMAFLNYLASCLGDETFVEEIVNAFFPTENGESALTPEVKEIVANIYSNPDLAIAAVVELLNQTEYALEDYEWYDGSTGGTVEGITPAAMVYLSSTNDWTKEKADYADEHISEIIPMIFEMAGSEVDFSVELTKLINAIFTNETLTMLAKSLSGLSTLLPKVIEVVQNELGIDFSVFEIYTELEDSHNWGFADGDREGFITALLELLSPFEPFYGFLLSDDVLTLFEDVNGKELVSFYGSEGYDTAIIPFLEALGCEVMTAAEFDKLDSGDTLETVLNIVSERLGEIEKEPIGEILDVLPSVLYYLASDGLTTAVRNLLHPVYVILDTIRPVYDIDLEEMLSLSDINGLDLENLGLDYALSIFGELTGLNLESIKPAVYDICSVIGTAYTSESEFLGEGKIGAYTENVFDRADMITVILSMLLELLEDEQNAAAFDELVQGENFSASLLAFFEGTEAETKSINWMYYFGEDHDFTDYDFETGINIEPTIHSLTYPNNWTEESAAYLDENLDSIASMLVNAFDENYTDLASLLKDYINIYTTEHAQAIADLLKSVVQNVEEDLLKTAGVLFDADFDALNAYTAPEGISTREEFVAAVTAAFETVPGVVNWLFFGDDYRFLTGSEMNEEGEYTYNDLIVINGAEGYRKGIAPILEAVGCENIPTGEEENAVELVFNALFSRFDELIADPTNEILEILPNVIYFLNADGLTACFYNMFSAVDALSESLKNLGVELSLDSLFGFDTSKFAFVDVVGYIEEATGLDLTPVKEIFAAFCAGTIKTYKSLSGEYAYKMSYSEDMDRKDMLTVLITAFLQVIETENNSDILREMFGEEVYTVMLNILNLKEFDMKEIEYLYTEHADTGKVFSALETSEIYADHEYGPLYTQEMAQYIADNIDEFIDNIIYLLGIEIGGINVDSLKELLNVVVNGSIYNSDTAKAILDAVTGFAAEVDALEGSEHIKALIKTSIGVDLDAWDNYTVPEFSDDRQMFTNTVCEILEPLYPVLEWALCNKDFTFFVNEDKTDIVTLLGAEGYAYGVVPILEVLGCENIPTPEEYYDAVQADKNALITSILNTLFDRVDVIMENPADEILEILPQVIYFINSNGLDTCFKNALHSVYGILGAVEPLVKVDLYELIDIRLDEVTFESLFEYAIDVIAEETGYEFTAFDINTIAELTVGTVVSYTSVNGETSYKMVYQSETAKAEMVTIVMRLLVTFIMNEDNREKAIGLLKDYLGMCEDAEQYVRAVFELIADCTVGTYLGMDKVLSIIYYLFYGTDIAVDETAGAVKDINSKWQAVLKKLGKSDNPDEATVGNLLAEILEGELFGDIFEDIIDTEEGIAPNGGISFFQKIFNLLKSFIEWFIGLFS